jgi:hypothetical protein
MAGLGVSEVIFCAPHKMSIGFVSEHWGAKANPTRHDLLAFCCGFHYIGSDAAQRMVFSFCVSGAGSGCAVQ